MGQLTRDLGCVRFVPIARYPFYNTTLASSAAMSWATVQRNCAKKPHKGLMSTCASCRFARLIILGLLFGIQLFTKRLQFRFQLAALFFDFGNFFSQFNDFSRRGRLCLTQLGNGLLCRA